MVKFNKHLEDYRYILSFDIAKYKTGYSLLDMMDNKVVLFGTIVCSEINTENIWAELYTKTCALLSKVIPTCGHDSMFVTKEKLPAQAGPHSTIGSLQALAQAHAIIDLACVHNGVEFYDDSGVHTRSVKAFYQKKTGIENPTKQDIAQDIANKYPEISGHTDELDMTDSIAVSETLVLRKWNADICDRIREIKREVKKFKSEKKKQELLHDIEELERLKIPTTDEEV